MIVSWQKSSLIALQGVADALIQRGHAVRVATPTEDLKYVTSLAEPVDAGPYPADPDGKWSLALDIFRLWEGVGHFGVSMYDRLLPAVRSRRPDVIVYDSLSLAGEALARNLGIPSVELSPHVTSLSMWCSEADWTTPNIISGLAKSRMSLSDQASNAISQFLFCYLLPFLKDRIQADARAHLALPSAFSFIHPTQDPALHSNAAPPTPSLLLLGNTLATEYARPLLPNAIRTGPFLPRHVQGPSKTDEEGRAVDDWLDRNAAEGRAVVYAAIGTNALWDARFLSVVLRALSHVLAAADDVAVLFMLSPERFPADASDIQAALQDAAWQSTLATHAERLMVRPAADQYRVLAHPAVRLFVTHSGLGSVQESLFHGVPMLLVPMMLESDQPTNAARLSELGLGRWVDRRRGEPTLEEFAGAISASIHDQEMRDRVQEMRKHVLSLGGSSYAAELIETVPLLTHLPQPIYLPPDRFSFPIFLLIVILILYIFKSLFLM